MARTVSEQLRAERRDQILQAAIPLFAGNGFSQTIISEVAQAAGVSHGTVFLYFANKDELFRAAVLDPLANFETFFLIEPAAFEAPLDYLRAMVIKHVAAFARQATYLRLTQYVLGQRDRFPELASELIAFVHRARDRMTPLILAGQARGELVAIDPVLVFWSYFSYLSGLGLVIQDSPDDPFWLELAKPGLRLFAPIDEADLLRSNYAG